MGGKSNFNQASAMIEKFNPLIDSTPLLDDARSLRKRGEADGYLFFKRLIPRDDILALRQELLEVVDRHGWRTEGQGPLGGEVNLDKLNTVPDAEMRLDIGVSAKAYNDVQKLERVHRLPHHPNLINLYRVLFGSEVLVHPRHIVRMITSHRSMVPTPPHQDFPLIQGTPRTWTCWFPLGDCPREMGGLVVLKGSHKSGCLAVQPTNGAGGLEAQLCPHEDSGWMGTDYEAGDVLTFPSLTVHRALKNQKKTLIRLSMDNRYQSATEVIEERSLKPHCDLEWEEIYAGWKKDDLKYYWRRSAPGLAPWDPTLIQPSRRIC